MNAIAATEYDLLIIDLFWNGEQLTAQDISQLRDKPGGGSRLIIAYMSIGEAEDYRYYWQQSWSSTPPSWLHGENPDWPGPYSGVNSRGKLSDVLLLQIRKAFLYPHDESYDSSIHERSFLEMNLISEPPGRG